MKLSEAGIGDHLRVVEVSGNGRVSKRLTEMGLVPGVAVLVIRAAPFGDPFQIRLRGYDLALRRSEAAGVIVDAEGGNEA
ncbi:MAG TPA: ferrous iron transport protein A [Pyrinomonadaceae bacterium]|nr:ferrous iron transport protein A [Pyrinomonadaceae bacterium]